MTDAQNQAPKNPTTEQGAIKREFSVGFVSLCAAVRLAAKLFQQMLFENKPKRGDVTSFNFKYCGFGDSFLGPDEHCEWGCQERRQPAS